MSIFKNRRALDHVFIPEKLPVREKDRTEIGEKLKSFFSREDSGYLGIHIFGSVGTGKTVLSKRVAYDLKETFHDLIVAYSNCRFSRRVYRVLADIVSQISEDLPRRGLSRDEFLELIFITSSEKSGRILIILDEIDSLFWGTEAEKARDMLYSISRFIEGYTTNDQKYTTSDDIPKHNLRVGIISISRDQAFMYQWLDPSTRASFIQSSKHLPQYTPKELYFILKYRAELALRDGAIANSELQYIANFVASNARGNARVAIDILRSSAEIAELQNSSYIKPEHIRKALEEHAFLPRVDDETLLGLGKQKLLLLLSIVRALKDTGGSYVTSRQVYSYYRTICEEYSEKPRKTTQLWRYLREIRHELSGIVEIFVTGKNQKGRSTRISINAPLDEFEKIIVKKIELLNNNPTDI